MFDWLKQLSPTERKTLGAAFGGWSVDSLDFMVYTFVIPTLMAAWTMTRAEAGLIATATLVVSAVGGWLAGILADRFGRVRVLQATILWFSVCTFLCGFAQSYEHLLLLRALQGLGFGGEWAVGAALVAEMVRPEHRGKAAGTVQSGWAVGWGIAAILFAVAFSVFPEDIAWRVMFWAGVLPALLVLFIRRHVPESELFHQTLAQVRQSGRSSHFLEIFAPAQLRITVFGCLLIAGLMSAYYAVVTWVPTYLKTVRGLEVLDTGGYTFVIIVGSWFGFMVAAYLTDMIGRRSTFLLFAVCTALVALAYTTLPISNGAMLALGFPLGFFVSGNFSGFGSYLAELFPSRMRGSGQGFVYNAARGLASFSPPLVGYLADHPPAWFAQLHWLTTEPLALSIMVVSVSTCALAIATLAFLPETKGKQLQAFH